ALRGVASIVVRLLPGGALPPTTPPPSSPPPYCSSHRCLGERAPRRNTVWRMRRIELSRGIRGEYGRSGCCCCCCPSARSLPDARHCFVTGKRTPRFDLSLGRHHSPRSRHRLRRSSSDGRRSHPLAFCTFPSCTCWRIERRVVR